MSFLEQENDTQKKETEENDTQKREEQENATQKKEEENGTQKKEEQENEVQGMKGTPARRRLGFPPHLSQLRLLGYIMIVLRSARVPLIVIILFIRRQLEHVFKTYLKISVRQTIPN